MIVSESPTGQLVIQLHGLSHAVALGRQLNSAAHEASLNFAA